MALWDSADLLARVRRHINRPSTDEALSDPQVYSFLEEAQFRWYEIIATHVPWVLYGAPEQLTTSDSGETYDFASTPFPGGLIELRESRSGRVLRVGAEWDPSVDFTWEGDSLRVPDGRTRSFSDGPYARYIGAPGALDENNEPTLKPAAARRLLVFGAAADSCVRVGHMDPQFFWKKEQEAAWGDPHNPGDVGIIGTLKKQVFGQAAGESNPGHAGWWASISPGYSVKP